MNEKHLELGTQAENIRDSVSRARWSKRSRLTEEQAKDAVQRVRSGASIRSLAVELGVSYQVVWNTVRGHAHRSNAEVYAPIEGDRLDVRIVRGSSPSIGYRCEVLEVRDGWIRIGVSS